MHGGRRSARPPAAAGTGACRACDGPEASCILDRATACVPGRSHEEIEAIVKPFKLDEVREALSDIGVTGLTVTEVKGFGRQKRPHRALSRRRVRRRFPAEGASIEVILPDDLIERAIEAIVSAARTGKIGDGKIFVTAVEQVVRIRTGESGEAAI